MSARLRTGLPCLALAAAAALATPAEEPAPSPVRFTEVESHQIRRSVTLPGTVEAASSSEVAAEVAGAVVERSAREGERVDRGAPLVVINKTDLTLRLRAAGGQLREAQARFDLADRNLARARDLFDSGVISRGEYDDAYSEYTAWQGRVDALTAEIERIETDLERCTIRAPFRGVVVRERTEVGQWVGVGDPVADLVSLDRLEVRVDVPELWFPKLRAGTSAALTFEALPNRKIEGRVVRIVPRAEPDARTFPVKIRILNAEGRIGVGMLARVALPLGEAYPALLVPKDAVVSQGERRFVYKMNGDDSIEAVDVSVGRGIGEWVVVEGALQTGQRVVTRGNERLQPGMRVRGEALRYDPPQGAS